MCSLNHLFEFKVNSTLFQNEVELNIVRQKIGEILRGYGFKEVSCGNDATFSGGFLTMYGREGGSHALLRGYEQGLVTLDIQEYVAKDQEPLINQDTGEELENRIKGSLMCVRCNRLPGIKRGQPVEVYFPTTDHRIIEYDFDECVFEADTPYQNVKIMHSPHYGNVLILDDDVNLAESDLPYTQAITGYPTEEYKNKTVLILGGGDGGILHELLKQSPAQIIMVDIDEVVVNAAVKHLRGICYDSMDHLKGDNYEVFVEDCIPVLERYIKEGKLFDYVINDLTAIPVTTQPIGDHWNFLRQILDLSMKVLHPNGRYYTQGNGANMRSALEMYERQLEKLSVPVSFNKQIVTVPSYLEQWVFYKIWKNKENEAMVEGES